MGWLAGGIAAWLAMGPRLEFNNDWQLDINTAVATELMLMTTFLQNTKRRHRLYMHRCSQKLGDLDAELEEQLLGKTSAREVIHCKPEPRIDSCMACFQSHIKAVPLGSP